MKCSDLKVKHLIDYENGNIGYINFSNIWHNLIKESAKCDNYASDILVDIVPVYKRMEECTQDTAEYYFGFRDMGIDHEDFINVRLENRDIYKDYRSIWKLSIYRENDEIFANLYEMDIDF